MSDLVWMDGQVLPAAEAMVSVSDRSFLYGDGLFESIPWNSGRLFRWREHWDRLTSGARFLGIRIAGDEAQVWRLRKPPCACTSVEEWALEGIPRAEPMLHG